MSAPPATLGFDAVLFDLDGVVTDTARLHAAAWAELFDDLLGRRAAERGEPFRPFDPVADYLAHVDGKPRYEGVRGFLAARAIVLPEGEPSDPPGTETVHGLGARKDALFLRRLRRDGVEVFAATIQLIRALRARGVKTAVVTSSRNGREVLRAAAIEDLHTVPDVARTLRLYRLHTLDGARRRARELGARGACYAWESTHRRRRDADRHPAEDERQGDADLHRPPADPRDGGRGPRGVALLGGHRRPRLPARRRRRDPRRDRAVLGEPLHARPRHYHLRGVVGPDEYHHSVNDNAYTNWMARFNLERAVEAVGWLRREAPAAWDALAARLALAPDEPPGWAAVARELHCPGPDARGVIEQFEGFFDLDDYPLPRDERFRAPISRLFDWDRINRLKLIKQADVLMLLHVFPDAFPPEVVAANYRYYEPITDHGSSLSPGIHAAVAARLGLREDAERYWRESLWLDLSNVMTNSALGVHPACMGATWQALVFGFLGVRFTDAGPVPHPDAAARLPARWGGVALGLAWHGDVHRVEVTKETPP